MSIHRALIFDARGTVAAVHSILRPVTRNGAAANSACTRTLAVLTTSISAALAWRTTMSGS
jgi:DNA-binding IclR family transcriptional regulator